MGIIESEDNIKKAEGSLLLCNNTDLASPIRKEESCKWNTEPRDTGEEEMDEGTRTGEWVEAYCNMKSDPTFFL